MAASSRARRLRSSLVATAPLSAALFGFCTLAETVTARQVWAWDHRAVTRVAAWGADGFAPLMALLSAVGGGTGLLLLTTLAAVAARRLGRRRDQWFLLVGVVGAFTLGRVLKDVLERPRPSITAVNDQRSVALALIVIVPVLGALAWATRWRRTAITVVACFTALVAIDRLTEALVPLRDGHDAFPSGHATGSMALASCVVVLAWGHPRRWLVAAGAAAFVAAVGLSRLHYGVHRPSELLAGWCVGALWVTVLWSVQRYERGRTLEHWAISVPLAVGSALIPLAI